MTLSWSAKRKLTVLSVFFSIFILMLSFFTYSIFYEKPTCFDGKQNQDEEGVDCGGICLEVCSFKASDPIVHWSRVFKVRDGVYNFTALIENKNKLLTAENVPYEVRVYDDKNILISQDNGLISIPAGSVFAVFKPSIDTGARIPSRAFLTILSAPNWREISSDNLRQVFVSESIFKTEETISKVEAILENRYVFPISNIDVYAILYDSEDNAFATSRTFIEVLSKESFKNIIFTWPEVFDQKPSRIEVLPVIRF